jgi:hypothetical protein
MPAQRRNGLVQRAVRILRKGPVTRRGSNHLFDDLRRTVDRHVQEYDMSCAEVVGVLQLVLAVHIRQVFQTMDEDEE